MSDKGWYGTSNVAEALRRIGNDFEEHHEERRWLHEIADEIERLREHVDHLREDRDALERRYEKAKQRIEELEKRILSIWEEHGYKITTAQIDAAWAILSNWNEDYADRVIAAAVRSTLEAALKRLNIVRCEGCEGDGHYDGSFDPERGLGTCRICNGRRWVIGGKDE